MSGVPYTFGTATTSIPLSNLDSNFVTPVTIGNASVALGNTISTIGNLTLNNVTINSGTINASVTESYSLANAVVYSNSTNLGVTSANLSFNGTTLTVANDASISGLTVGKGGGAVASNTAVGYQAGYNNTTGVQNALFGYQAGYSNTTAGSNTYVGYQTGLYQTGSNNSAFGITAFQGVSGSSTGINNCAFGGTDSAVGVTLASNTTGGQNNAFGNGALGKNSSGSSNSAFGHQALSSNTTASNNTAVGYQAGYSNTSGSAIVALGYQALYANTTGQNTAVGGVALAANTTGTNNTAVGFASFQNSTTGSNNTGIGHQALNANTTASNNTAVGFQAGYSNTTGAGNIFVGASAGQNLTTGSNCTYIGINIIPSSVSVNNEMVISAGGGGATGKGATTGFINPGGAGMYQGNNSAAWSITSDARLKKNIVDNTTGLSAITAIQVRNFEYRTADEITELPVSSAIDIKGVQLGAIAQELQAILPDCVKTESTGVMSVDTTNLTWYLINAVKELNAKITALENK